MGRDHHITKFRNGFLPGYTRILSNNGLTGMEFGIVRLQKAASYETYENGAETALILLSGYCKIDIGTEARYVRRRSIFTEKPYAFLIPPRTPYSIWNKGGEDLEVAVIKTRNDASFNPVALRPNKIPSEHRGEGAMYGTMHRVVRAVFGDPNAPPHARPPESNLVVGEVVNFQGRWSSYPPHGHPQPEIYYYRFDKPYGYGHAETGDKVSKVKTHDVVQILNGVGHAQTSAPGYMMWYLWAIRHLPDKRYEGDPPFTFEKEHEWILGSDAHQQILKPEEIV